MKYRVKWHMARTFWWRDLDTKERAEALVNQLRSSGFTITSKAGVTTFYLPHRIWKITLKRVRGN